MSDKAKVSIAIADAMINQLWANGLLTFEACKRINARNRNSFADKQ